MINRSFLLLLLPPLFWAGNALLARATAGDLPPVALAFWRWILALALILPFTGRDLWASRGILWRHWRPVLGMALTSVAAYNTLLYLAVQTTTAINATLVGTALPIMVLLLARLWLGDPIRPRQTLGMAVSIIGLLTVVTRGEPARLATLTLTPGDGLMLLASASWATYSVMLRRFPIPVRGFTLLTALIVLGWLMILPFYLFELSLGYTVHLRPMTLGVIAYTAVCASLLAYYFWNLGVASVGAPTAGLFANLIPLFTAILGVALLGETFAWFHALGGGLIFAGIALATMRRR
ncbi:DMT family transporter [Magnetospirillum sulfuroxidans]|uniref:DMT family transporter n=1 Tax=Magnetospirillum sulfuroxidans TaxID=611300 RepID=A0ABS5I8T3_9PROT|nr:DMT family transporter [Magnetospirillum sulfuroxidans]